MLEIAIIADDLTGAADTGVQFCPYFNGTLLTAYQNLSSAPSGAFHFDAQALAVFTNSRAIDAESARERVQSVARHLVRLRPGHIYKKVDSCIRGNIGVEVETVMDEMGYDLSFTAPAFPEMGRTTLHDVHLVDGTPVARTELSRDPVTPVTESRLSRTMALQCRYPVGHVDLKYLDGVDEVLSGEIDSLVHLGARHLVFDATKQTHLDRIAHFALDSPEKVLLVGSAGLAESLGRHFPKRPLVEENELKPIPEGNHLLICGTTSEHTRLQISTVIDRYPYEVIPLEPDLLADPTRREELFLKSRFAQSVLSRDDSIINIRTPKQLYIGFIGHRRSTPYVDL